MAYPYFLISSRSSRLFVVLVHLAGVTYLPSSILSSSIRVSSASASSQAKGQFSIVLEQLDPSSVDQSPDSVHWIQDSADAACLGPNGVFAECGDATFWNILPNSKRKRSRWMRWSARDSDAFALRVVDDRDAHSVGEALDFAQGECLVPTKKHLVPCSSDKAWHWQVTANGILHYAKQPPRRLTKVQLQDCITRTSSSSQAALSSCDEDSEDVVRFTVVRQRSVDDGIVMDESTAPQLDDSAKPSSHLPSSMHDAAHTYATQQHSGNTAPPAHHRVVDALNTQQSMTKHAPAATVHQPRKMRTHPYNKDEHWIDPVTGLRYATDLSSYLGYDRKQYGQHMLTGVGQYTRTVFNINVYGIAYYVSKRDVLADADMQPYADLDAEQLRARPDFYDILRGDSNDNHFDRTILLKINMKLGTDTMRDSLEADWKMLTAEGKDLLINSSLKPRPASPTMLRIIEDPIDNPGRCSCAQIAPPQYNSNPDCCARGTELVFTWRKNGDLEARLNGDYMDTFERPDLAAAIFFEYLRLDDPMSSEFLDRVVDGFPYLLGPLASVKGGMSHGNADVVPSMSTHEQHHTSSKTNSIISPFVKLIGSASDTMTTHATSMTSRIRTLLQDEMERCRNVFRKQQSSKQGSMIAIVTSQSTKQRQLQQSSHTTEIPIQQQCIFALVHLYLILLFIVSLPTTKIPTTTVVVITNKSTAMKRCSTITSRTEVDSVSDSESESDDDFEFSHQNDL